jgi:magnesium transporter
MIVGFGLDLDTGESIEVHVYLTDTFIVSFRQRASATLDRLHSTGSMRQLLGSESIRLVHHLTTMLHDDFEPYIAQLEDRLGALETEMLDEPLDEHLAEIAAIRQQADQLRRTLTPGRDLAVRTTVAIDLPGTTSDAVLYASDIADELRLIVSDLAAIGERCVAAMGLHASLASNRQAAAGQQLAVVATVFLPITFVVGLFGMNFDVLVNDVEQGWPRFLIFGIGLNVLCIAATLFWFRRRGWR